MNHTPLLAERDALRAALEEMVERFSHYVHKPIPPIQLGCQADDEWLAIQQARAALDAAEEAA